MIEINNKEFRNLQEQVEYLTELYPALTKQLPYNGPYESLDAIPDDVLVDNGTYLVGTDSFTIYKYDESTEDFTSLGLFGAKGDKGDKGDTGETGAAGSPGLKGETGESAGFGDPEVTVKTIAAVEDATCEIVASGPDTAKVFTFNFIRGRINLQKVADITKICYNYGRTIPYYYKKRLYKLSATTCEVFSFMRWS